MLKEAIEAAGRKPYANEAEAEGTVLLKVLVLTKYIPYDIFCMDYRIQILKKNISFYSHVVADFFDSNIILFIIFFRT